MGLGVHGIGRARRTLVPPLYYELSPQLGQLVLEELPKEGTNSRHILIQDVYCITHYFVCGTVIALVFYVFYRGL